MAAAAEEAGSRGQRGQKNDRMHRINLSQMVSIRVMSAEDLRSGDSRPENFTLTTVDKASGTHAGDRGTIRPSRTVAGASATPKPTSHVDPGHQGGAIVESGKAQRQPQNGDFGENLSINASFRKA
jgi:hypothetical protein